MLEKMQKSDIGIIGMGVMGQNLALNIESKGFAVAVYNRTKSRTEEFMRKRSRGKKIRATYSLEDFVESLDRPRRILLMVKAGSAVDIFIEKLTSLLEKGDIIIDGGNSHFEDTERRCREVENKGMLYLGTGISGGEQGALHGPCIMPGGNRQAYKHMEKIFIKASAWTEDGPCCTYLGPTSAGHYVKMVHNGIEYAVMQIIAECYHLMSTGLKMKIEDIQKVFNQWNRAELNSYLMEITADILGKKDDATGKPLVEVILDKAEQKGTGRWTSKSALDLGVPIPTITAAVNARIISSFKSWRNLLSERLVGPKIRENRIDRKKFLSRLKDTCYAGILSSYIQGMHLLTTASREYNYEFSLSEIARIWKGGCIIRARVLDTIKDICQIYPTLPNLLLSDELKGVFNQRIPALREVAVQAKKWGIPTPAIDSCLNYYDSFRTATLPANLVQAQRDFFGAHGYERVDKEGTFHTMWQKDKAG